MLKKINNFKFLFIVVNIIALLSTIIFGFLAYQKNFYSAQSSFYFIQRRDNNKNSTIFKSSFDLEKVEEIYNGSNVKGFVLTANYLVVYSIVENENATLEIINLINSTQIKKLNLPVNTILNVLASQQTDEIFIFGQDIPKQIDLAGFVDNQVLSVDLNEYKTEKISYQWFGRYPSNLNLSNDGELLYFVGPKNINFVSRIEDLKQDKDQTVQLDSDLFSIIGFNYDNSKIIANTKDKKRLVTFDISNKTTKYIDDYTFQDYKDIANFNQSEDLILTVPLNKQKSETGSYTQYGIKYYNSRNDKSSFISIFENNSGDLNYTADLPSLDPSDKFLAFQVGKNEDFEDLNKLIEIKGQLRPINSTIRVRDLNSNKLFEKKLSGSEVIWKK